MLRSVKEINEKNKCYIAYFTYGTTTKFGQSDPKQGIFIDHGNKTLRKTILNDI